MAKNPPKGPGRKGAVKQRSQSLNPRTKRWTKRGVKAHPPLQPNAAVAAPGDRAPCPSCYTKAPVAAGWYGRPRGDALLPAIHSPPVARPGIAGYRGG